MSKLLLLRVLQSLLTGILTGFAIIGAEAVFVHQLPAGRTDVAFPLFLGLAASIFGFVIWPALEPRLIQSTSHREASGP